MSDPVVKQMRKLDQKLKDVSACIQPISRQNSQSRVITQIACIRRKQAAGATLQPDQESKMAREEEVRQSLHALQQQHPDAAAALAKIFIASDEARGAAAAAAAAKAAATAAAAIAASASAAAAAAASSAAAAAVAPESTSLAAAASAHHFERAHLLCTEAKFASAVAEYEKGIALGHGASHAELANILIDGRNGVPCDIFRAFQLADKGSRLCCPHSQGVLAWCYAQGLGVTKDQSRALKLARESAAADSRYGHFALDKLTFSYEGSASAYEESVTHTELAAAQNLVRI